MTRYADIDKVLEIINEVNADGGFTSYANYTYLFDSIDSLPTFEQPNWIPCAKKLPEHKRETYWVCTDVQSQHECRWTNNMWGLGESDEWEWSIFDLPLRTNVVAWMKLPRPYEEKDYDND